ncbi:hypothetical protein CHGG_03361 [Chaetomium globosum CBS 148.51]|uniref:Uncharacterized protein n=1 Tax=Chaetomium globosum (strain ATCC 6205 / CBS 148.51 / DSM 1962 / NBRC 6347 / NRRL 1970) TaxID=306901 RepID=Q2H8U3_CHAGB|nr:uncharacterized protein CHGG_03361 [Chaetomium globosum CBS 148.51]EAQ91426.1 hypothetical protein CHGG_03361 [Chaetomium globosum CBS 148.51]
MPARGRSPAPSLPPVLDEATVPFSDLFKSGFDPAAIDAATQLADRSIFVASNGSRYRIEKIPDQTPVEGRVTTLTPVSAAAAVARPASLYASGSTLSGSPASLPPPQLHVHAPPGTGLGWGRSPSNASSYSRSSGAPSTRSGYAGAAFPAPEPRASIHEVSNTMAQLSINGFGARPLYGMSDGGVQAAETLTDPDLAPRAPMIPGSPGREMASPRASYAHHEQPSHYQAASWGPHDYPSPGAAPQYWTNVNYASYTTQTYAHLQSSRQNATATTGLPSLLEDATPLPPPPHRASDPTSTFSSGSPDKEAWDGQGVGTGYPYHPLHPSISAPSFVGRKPTYVNTGPGDIDTLTPVVVHDHAQSTASDGAMKASNAQLIPAYAYDQRLPNVVYIRDKENDNVNGYTQGNSRPSGIYQFSSLKELFDFQAKLTGEKVVLDIGSVRMVTISKASSRSSTQFSSARLQIWHEPEGRRTAQSDVASFVTAGTALSGPLRERLVASSSRLMLYLGRSGGYITVFTAHLEPNQGSEPAGFDIHGKSVEVDVGSDYDSYKTFEIEFENSPNKRLQRTAAQSAQAPNIESACSFPLRGSGTFVHAATESCFTGDETGALEGMSIVALLVFLVVRAQCGR